MNFGNLHYIHLIWLAPVLGLIFLYGFHRRRHALEAFARSELLGHLVSSVDRGRQYLRVVLVLAAAALLAVSIARPRWGSEVQEIHRKGIDLVVLLDLSKSMLAQETSLSRLDRARADLLELLPAIRGDRIGLVAFAGNAEIRCPLTFDYGFFQQILSELDVGTVALGGTSIALAMHEGLNCFQDEYPNYKAMLLITDGEDHGEFVEEQIEKARQRNVRIFAVGIGDQEEGRRVPILGEDGKRRYLQDSSGQLVFSKMNPTLLRRAATETGGAYISAGTGSFSLVDLYDEQISAMEERELEGSKTERYKERYQWFLAISLLFLAIEPLVSTRKRSSATGQERHGQE